MVMVGDTCPHINYLVMQEEMVLATQQDSLIAGHVAKQYGCAPN